MAPWQETSWITCRACTKTLSLLPWFKDRWKFLLQEDFTTVAKSLVLRYLILLTFRQHHGHLTPWNYFKLILHNIFTAPPFRPLIRMLLLWLLIYDISEFAHLGNQPSHILQWQPIVWQKEVFKPIILASRAIQQQHGMDLKKLKGQAD